MTMQLFQFGVSPYCEKIRFVLEYKGLDYEPVELDMRAIRAGRAQLVELGLADDTTVPVLKDGDTIVEDSTFIAQYLDEKYPAKPLYPADPAARAQVHMWEDWADESLGDSSRRMAVWAMRAAFPEKVVKEFSLKYHLNDHTAALFEKKTHQDVQAFMAIKGDKPFLVGDSITMADVAVSAQLFTLAAVPAFQERYAPLFAWREDLEKLRHV